ncbi:putative ferric-chelate reductase 1 isoform X2 [Mercenaria mercenaria]|nr:putative ferric-chelate reductase 1 isoform X2 [Mercenaria mercenaria]
MPEDMLIIPYTVDTDVTKYRPGQKITVTLQSSDTKSPLRGFFIQAVQAGIHLRDLRRRAFGKFENTTDDERPSVCQSFRTTETTGITHSNNKGKQRVTVTWVAPTEYNPGEIQFLATGVLDYATYWTDIRSQRLIPDGYNTPSENNISGRYTPTAAWFRWLQYLRQMQLLKQNLGIPIKASQDTNGAGHDHDHHHHHHDHHDHAHDHAHGVTNKTDAAVTPKKSEIPTTTVKQKV